MKQTKSDEMKPHEHCFGATLTFSDQTPSEPSARRSEARFQTWTEQRKTCCLTKRKFQTRIGPHDTKVTFAFKIDGVHRKIYRN